MERTVEFSRTEVVRVVHPQDMNGAGRLFGGALLKMLDELAGIVAMRHCQNMVPTTAAIDNLQFKEAAYLNDLLVLIGYVTYTGNTSLEVRVDTYVEDKNGMRRPINRAYFVMVALGEDGKPAKVPQLKLQTESEKAEWEGALRRRKIRLERRTEGY